MGIRTTIVAALALILSGCGGGGGGGGSPAPPAPATPAPVPGPATQPVPAPSPVPGTATGDPMVSPLMVASSWEVGPIINGQNYSAGVPTRPTQTNDGWAVDFPLAGGHVNYVTFPYGSLTGKSRIVMRYRIEADPGVKFVPKCCPELLGQGPTMYIQVANDDWQRDGGRWFATFNSPSPIVAGEFELNIPLDGNWTSVLSWTASDHPSEFGQAKAGAGRIGFTFGGGDGYGHGVYATGRARMVVTSFAVE